MTYENLLYIYQAATGDDPYSPIFNDGDRNEIAEEMRRVIAAPTEEEAIRIIAWWGNDHDVGPGTNLRTVCEARRVACEFASNPPGSARS